MNQYLSIGKVSKMKNVSIKSLRYYDKIGILKPAFVNAETNYRYYTEEQLYLLDAVTLCIKLGIPLKDLHQYVENDTINLQRLLYDGKILAEEKIMDIHQCLEALQDTLQKLSSSANGTMKIPEYIPGPDGHDRSVGRHGYTEILRTIYSQTFRYRTAKGNQCLLSLRHSA